MLARLIIQMMTQLLVSCTLLSMPNSSSSRGWFQSRLATIVAEDSINRNSFTFEFDPESTINDLAIFILGHPQCRITGITSSQLVLSSPASHHDLINIDCDTRLCDIGIITQESNSIQFGIDSSHLLEQIDTKEHFFYTFTSIYLSSQILMRQTSKVLKKISS